MKLIDYNMLAYEFAVRNPRVIQLLAMDLTKEVADELKTYGFELQDEEGYHPLGSLYLGYDHLKHLQLPSFKPSIYDSEYAWEHNYKVLVNPERKGFRQIEDSIDAIERIKSLIESRGGKLKRLVDGRAFKNYDAVTFFDESIYSHDPTTNTAKTINSDIDFITEWIQPEKYLQLIPLYKKLFD